MNPRKRLWELHNELAEFYRSFRGTVAPRTSWTEGIWREITRLESETAREEAPDGR